MNKELFYTAVRLKYGLNVHYKAVGVGDLHYLW